MGEYFIATAPRLREVFEPQNLKLRGWPTGLGDSNLKKLTILTHGVPDRLLEKVKCPKLRALSGRWAGEKWLFAGDNDPPDWYRDLFDGPADRNISGVAFARQSGSGPHDWPNLWFGLEALLVEVQPSHLTSMKTYYYSGDEALSVFGYIALNYDSPELGRWLEREFGREWKARYDEIRTREKHRKANDPRYLSDDGTPFY